MNATKKSWNSFRRLICRAALDEQGTSLLEMAFLLPILILLLLGIVDVGRYAELSIRVANAARAGAQYGAQSLADANDVVGIARAANDDAPTASMVVSPAIVCHCSDGSTCSHANPCIAPNTQIEYVNVTVTGVFTPLFNYPGLTALSNVSGSAQMRVAW